MLKFYVYGQRLRMENTVIAGDTIDYLTAEFIFQTEDWADTARTAIFQQGNSAYSVLLTEDRIRAEDHLNLSAGEWTAHVVGSVMDGEDVAQRITTTQVRFMVEPSGAVDGETFPAVSASYGEQILAAALAAKATAQSVLDDADAGVFDGSPGIVVSETEPTDEHHPVWLDPNGEADDPVMTVNGIRPDENGNVAVATGEVSPEEIAAAVEGYLTENPVAGTMVVNIVDPNMSFSYKADHTYAEIEAALNAGQMVLVKLFDEIFVPAGYGALNNEPGLIFVHATQYENRAFASVNIICFYEDGGIMYNEGSQGTYVKSVNGKTGAVKLTAADVGALPVTTEIPAVPTQVSAFENDAGYLTEHQELPTTLPNPNKLTLTGAVEAEYDGSEAVTVEIPSGGGDNSLAITGAQVGQIAKITAVDDEGKPTAWEAVELPGRWKLFAELTLEEDIQQWEIDLPEAWQRLYFLIWREDNGYICQKEETGVQSAYNVSAATGAFSYDQKSHYVYGFKSGLKCLVDRMGDSDFTSAYSGFVRSGNAGFSLTTQSAKSASDPTPDFAHMTLNCRGGSGTVDTIITAGTQVKIWYAE